MIVVTSLRKGTPGTRLYGRTGVGFGNHSVSKSNVLFAFDLVADKLLEEKAIFQDKKSLMEEILIPAFEKAGSKNPKAMATNIYGWWLKEGKLVEVTQTNQRTNYPSYA